MEKVPPGTQEFPTAVWMQHSFNQTMDWTNRRLVQQSFVLPGVGVMEDIPTPRTPEIPKNISWYARKIRDIIIIQLIVKMIRECINWILEHL